MIHRTLNLYRSSFGGLSREIWLLALVTFINRAGTMVIPFLTIYLTQQLHFTKPQAGWVMSSFGLGSVLGTYIGGQLTDRFGYYYIQFWTLLLSGLMFIVLSEFDSFYLVCLLVFFLSTIGDAFRPANFASVAAYSKPENRTRSYSLLRLAINLGFSAGPALGGLLAAWKGYKWLFWVDGLTCVGAAFTFLYFLSYKKEPEEERDAEGKLPPLRSAYQDKVFLLFTFFILLSAICFMQLFSTMPIYYKEQMLLNEGQIGMLLALNGLLVAILEMPTVYSLEGKNQHLNLIAGGIFLTGLSYFIFLPFGHWVGIGWVAVVLITLGEIFSMPFANAYALDRSSPRNRGQYMGLYSMTYSIAIIVSPVLGLQVAAYFGFDSLWILLSVLSAISVGGILFMKLIREK